MSSRLVAGIDIGNATTEVVVASIGAGGDSGVEVLHAARVPTRRDKGSPASLEAAALLVRRIERRIGNRVAEAYVAPLRPVLTRTATVPERGRPVGRLRVMGLGAGTPGAPGYGVGPPYVLDGVPATEPDGRPGQPPVVVLVPAGTGYRRTVELLTPLLGSGRVAAICLADDEAVLVANRVPDRVPVVDEVDVESAARAVRLAVEVSTGGRPLRRLGDAWRLVADLDLDAPESVHAAAVAERLADATNAVVAVLPEGAGPAAELQPGAVGSALLMDGTTRPLAEVVGRLARRPVGWVRGVTVPPALQEDLDDLWGVDLAAVVAQVHGRARALGGRPVGLALLRSAGSAVDATEPLAALLGVPVTLASSEGAAARAGALSTPGGSPEALVVDLGAGTADVVAAEAEVVAAGGGQLLTEAVAAVTGTTAAAAEHVKRGASFRVEAPQVVLAEDGSRDWLDRPADRDAVGTLAVRGPAGLLPFSRDLAPGEWRALRLRLKSDVLGANVTRALAELDAAGRPVVLVGGPTDDDEVLTAVTAALPPGAVVARGDVAGRLGCRYAVAFGLVLGASR